ncbi:hypothetical protein SOCE26_036880 [Sorangium cellulosum]|uniref:Secreted protein n=1 Tax=Sorangium cellulosum TaxID=56 RepID=A0A2L0ESF9_SORCE|nr:hypothetical protein [Sorangium cellulosum]AUX42258.1 hypothetical protein SOCE26_036880 [Sorangium cellulosum]
MSNRTRYALSALLAAASLSVAGPVSADVTIWGDVSPQNPTDPWDLGVTPLRVWNGAVEVTDGGTLISPGASVQASDFGAIQIDGYGSTWINTGSIEVGSINNSEDSWIIIRNGAEAVTDELVVGLGGDRNHGSVLVEGYDATLTSRATTYIGTKGNGSLELKQGATFFSHDVYFGGGIGNSCGTCTGEAIITGTATRWVSTGEFVLGMKSRGLLDIRNGQLSTMNARITGDDHMHSRASVSGWGGTWTNQGLLQVGSTSGYGTLTVGAYGTLLTEDTEIHSQLGGGFVKVSDVHASWLNSGDVTVFATGNQYPSLLVDKGALVSIGGLLQTAPMVSGYPYLGPSVRLADGDLIADAIQVVEGDFDFVGGRLETGSFVGDLANMQAGELSVGEAHPSTAVAGSYSQGPGATLRITVTGTSALPLLQVDGDLNLDGALKVLPDDGSVSFQVGDTIALLGWSGGLTGTFAAVDIALPLGPGLTWDTSALYTTGEITVVPAA